MKAGPHVAGSSIVATAGSVWTTCAGLTMRSQRVTGLKVSFTVTDGSPKPSTCWRTGSGMRLANVSPTAGAREAVGVGHGGRGHHVRRAGLMELVATMICRRRMALA